MAVLSGDEQDSIDETLVLAMLNHIWLIQAAWFEGKNMFEAYTEFPEKPVALVFESPNLPALKTKFRYLMKQLTGQPGRNFKFEIVMLSSPKITL